MKTQNRIVHVLFVLALLLGITPITMGAPALQQTSQGSEPSAVPLVPQARPSQAPVVPDAPAPAAPAQADSFPPPSGLSVDERLRLNTVERFASGVAAFDNVNGYGYFVVNSEDSSYITRRFLVKVNLADNTRVDAIGFWPGEGGILLADPQRDMLYAVGNKVTRVRLSTFKRVDAITLPEGIDLHGEAVMTSDQASAYFSTSNGVVHLRLPDFAVLGGMNDIPSNWVGPLTLDEANGRIYMANENSRICTIELADWSSECQTWGQPTNTAPVIDIALGFAYYGSGYTMYKVRLSDMAYFTTTLTSPDPVGNSFAISPDNEFAYFYYQNTNVSPREGTIRRVRLSDFTLKSCDINNYYDPDFDNPILNPVSGTVYVGLQRQDEYHLYGSEYDPYKIGAYWGGEHDSCSTGRILLYADQEHADDLMLDAANGYAYTYGEIGKGQPPGTDKATYYGLTKIRLSDFTRSGALEVMTVADLGGTEEFMRYMGGGINLQDGYIDLAFHFQGASSGDPVRDYIFRRVRLADDIVGGVLSNRFDERWVDEYPDYGKQNVLYDFPQGVVYHNRGDYKLSRSVIQGNYITTTHITETTSAAPAGSPLAVDGLHDHIYTSTGADLYKRNGTDLSLEATLAPTDSLSGGVQFLALDPPNDAAYMYAIEKIPVNPWQDEYVRRLFKLRLSDFSVVMSRTVPYRSSVWPHIQGEEKNVVLDPASGYGYFLAYGPVQYEYGVVQFRLDDLSITDYAEINTLGAMALDPEEGAIYIAAIGEVLKIGLSGGKSVTPAANVPYHGTVTYTLNLAGHMTLTDTHVVLTDTLPAKVDFLDWVEQPTGATVTDDVIHWSGPLDPREVVTLTFTAQHTGAYNDTVLNSAEYSGTVVHRTMRATFQVESPPPLPLVKTVTPTEAGPGDPVVYTLHFTNTTGVAATGVVITDILPAILESPQVSSSVAITVLGSTQYVWALKDDLESFASGVITLTGQLAADTPTGPLTNIATLLGVTDGVTHTHSASAVLEVSGAPPAPPKLAISKTAEEYQNAPPLLVGDRILYTIRVTNTTTGTLTNLIVTDTLPAGVSYFGIPKGSPRPDQTGNPVVWTQASLDADATQTFRVIVKATGAPTPIGDNTATATCAEDSTPRTATANLDDANVQEALTLLKDAVDLNGEPLLVDDVIRYTIYVTNTHDTVTLTGVVVTDTLPAGTVFVTATQSYTEAGGTLWWQVGDLAPGASWTVEVDQRVDGSANPIAGNHAAVWCDQQDWQGTGDVYPPDPVIKTDLALGKTAEEYRNAPPLLVGDRILYTIRVTNTTTGALTNLRITDTLPAGVSYFGIPKGSPRPDQTGNPVVWTLDSLAAGQTQTFKVIVKVDGSANPIGVNQVQATCAEETTVAAASAQVPGDGVHAPGLVVTGTVGGGGGTMAQVTRAPASALDVGDLLTYTVMVTNSNDSLTLHNLAVTVTLPSGVEWVRMTPAGSTALLPVLVWEQAELGPGMGWRATIVVSQTSETIGTMHAVASSDEQSPVEVTIGGAEYRVYLPLVLR